MVRMPSAELSINRAVVFASALVYWAGVYVQTRRIRRRIGHAPNVKPRGLKETLLWVGWFLVVAAWLALPFLAGVGASSPWVRISPSFCGFAGLFSGIVLMGLGYAGTLWCYAAMGNTWRMGVNRAEKTPLVKHGPFRFVRHPIYLFQVFMLAGMVLLLPAPASLVVLGVHVLCIASKAADEENHLRTVHGEEYRDYLSRRGRFLPKLRFKSKS
jgi:protein-S-isoprenylcysteine O-methyltransferase Ste14